MKTVKVEIWQPTADGGDLSKLATMAMDQNRPLPIVICSHRPLGAKSVAAKLLASRLQVSAIVVDLRPSAAYKMAEITDGCYYAWGGAIRVLPAHRSSRSEQSRLFRVYSDSDVTMVLNQVVDLMNHMDDPAPRPETLSNIEYQELLQRLLQEGNIWEPEPSRDDEMVRALLAQNATASCPKVLVYSSIQNIDTHRLSLLAKALRGRILLVDLRLFWENSISLGEFSFPKTDSAALITNGSDSTVLTFPIPLKGLELDAAQASIAFLAQSGPGIVAGTYEAEEVSSLELLSSLSPWTLAPLYTFPILIRATRRRELYSTATQSICERFADLTRPSGRSRHRRALMQALYSIDASARVHPSDSPLDEFREILDEKSVFDDSQLLMGEVLLETVRIRSHASLNNYSKSVDIAEAQLRRASIKDDTSPADLHDWNLLIIAYASSVGYSTRSSLRLHVSAALGWCQLALTHTKLFVGAHPWLDRDVVHLTTGASNLIRQAAIARLTGHMTAGMLRTKIVLGTMCERADVASPNWPSTHLSTQVDNLLVETIVEIGRYVPRDAYDKNAMERLAKELSQAASWAGYPEASAQAGHMFIELEAGDVVDRALARFYGARDLLLKSEILEKFIVEVEPNEIQTDQRKRVVKAFAKLSKLASAELLFVSHRFWREQQLQWKPGHSSSGFRVTAGVEHGQAVAMEKLSQEGSPSPPELRNSQGPRTLSSGGGAQILREINSLIDGLAREHNLVVFHALHNLWHFPEALWDSDVGDMARSAVTSALVRLNDVGLADSIWNETERNADAPAFACFQYYAAKAAQLFASLASLELAPASNLRLSMCSALTLAARMQYADAAFEAAHEQGRVWQLLRAAQRILRLAAADPEMALRSVARVCWGFQQYLNRTRGSIVLLEVAFIFSKWMRRQANWLANRGLAEAAFTFARASRGARSELIASDPRLVVEYEMTERFFAERTPESQSALFSSLRDRIGRVEADWVAAGMLQWPLPTLTIPAGTAVLWYGTYSSFVWCIGALKGVRGNPHDVEYFVKRIDISRSELQALSTSLWGRVMATAFDSMPQSISLPVLKDLHEIFIGPIAHYLAAVDRVEFLLHGKHLSELPLHAAFSNGKHLIEEVQVGYLHRVIDIEPVAVGLQAVCVAGWDPAIGAQDESRSISSLLRRNGVSVVRPNSVREGAAALLDGTPGYRVVHLACHGRFLRSPHSLESTLNFTKTLSISAGLWLSSATRTQMVFANACNIGTANQSLGDIEGFPLAFYARGAETVIAPFAPVFSRAAHEFASEYYANFLDLDSTAAFQITCIGQIRAGRNLSSWVPYFHVGRTHPALSR